MSEYKYIKTPLNENNIKDLKAGDEVMLSGVIYTARDQAHLKMDEIMKKEKILPIKLSGGVIYYCGPTPRGNRIIGSCGPTTSSRMDSFSSSLLDAGLKGMIGKGRRSQDVVEAIKRNKAVYFLASGGAGAYLASRVKSCELVAFGELGPEAIYKLSVQDFPLIVGIDSEGNDIYERLK